jgi:uncharacterized protein (TIGR02117 family)
MHFLLLLYLSPLFATYLVLCLTLPLIRVGEIKKGKGIKFYISKDMIHSDYVFESSLWKSEFQPKGKYIKIGWGDRKIFLETRCWSELRTMDFLFAFFGLNKTVLRIDFMDDLPQGSTEMEVDNLQLEILKIYVKESHSGKKIQKKPHYYQKGDFYESNLRYNCFTNCNNWVNRGLFIARATNRAWCPITFWL